jgi:hypothetical protein
MATMDSKQKISTFLDGAGYSDEQIAQGFDYADAVGWSSTDELGQLALSRILFSDEQLNDGAMAAWEPVTPRVIVYLDTLRLASLDGAELTDEDEQTYDDRIGDYLDFLENELAGFGLGLEKADSIGGRSYTVEDDAPASHEAMQSIPDFWEWYQRAC